MYMGLTVAHTVVTWATSHCTSHGTVTAEPGSGRDCEPRPPLEAAEEEEAEDEEEEGVAGAVEEDMGVGAVTEYAEEEEDEEEEAGEGRAEREETMWETEREWEDPVVDPKRDSARRRMASTSLRGSSLVFLVSTIWITALTISQLLIFNIPSRSCCAERPRNRGVADEAGNKAARGTRRRQIDKDHPAPKIEVPKPAPPHKPRNSLIKLLCTQQMGVRSTSPAALQSHLRSALLESRFHNNSACTETCQTTTTKTYRDSSRYVSFTVGYGQDILHTTGGTITCIAQSSKQLNCDAPSSRLIIGTSSGHIASLTPRITSGGIPNLLENACFPSHVSNTSVGALGPVWTLKWTPRSGEGIFLAGFLGGTHPGQANLMQVTSEGCKSLLEMKLQQGTLWDCEWLDNSGALTSGRGLLLYDITTNKALRSLKGTSSEVVQLSTANTVSALLAGCRNGTVSLADTRDPRGFQGLMCQTPGQVCAMQVLTLSPWNFIVSSTNNHLAMWDLRFPASASSSSSTATTSPPPPPPPTTTTSSSPSPCKSNTRQVVVEYSGHVNSHATHAHLSLFMGESLVSSGSSDGRVRLWDVLSGKQMCQDAFAPPLRPSASGSGSPGTGGSGGGSGSMLECVSFCHLWEFGSAVEDYFAWRQQQELVRLRHSALSAAHRVWGQGLEGDPDSPMALNDDECGLGLARSEPMQWDGLWVATPGHLNFLPLWDNDRV
ncbi:DDB1- and CUL4-associated factor 4 [Pelomyxa schiedti]|nr:DDB1- and CUL4-associated factor 4 [Pelomyxa schiedti]